MPRSREPCPRSRRRDATPTRDRRQRQSKQPVAALRDRDLASSVGLRSAVGHDKNWLAETCGPAATIGKTAIACNRDLATLQKNNINRLSNSSDRSQFLIHTGGALQCP